MRKLYVCSKSLPTKKGLGNQPRLIGVLTELKPGGNKPEQYGEYQFEYKLGEEFPEWFLKLEEFPDISRVYRNTPEVTRFIKRFLPTSDFKYLQDVLDSRGLKHYDEWRLLTNDGINEHSYVHLHVVLPSNVMAYEKSIT